MNNNEYLELKWDTQPPLIYHDKYYGQLELFVTGNCHYKINNLNVPREQIEQLLIQNILMCLKKFIYDNNNQSYIDITTKLTDFVKNDLLKGLISNDFLIDDLSVLDVRLTDASNLKIDEIEKQKIQELQNKPKIVQTDIGAKDGQNKCPKCGATEITLNVNNGKLRCNYCRHEFESEKVVGLEEDISKLEGQVIGSGAQDILADTNDVLTFKCSSCGAEVVIDTNSSNQARCHWCRSTLSVNQQIPNGSIPDVVLPFALKKEEAKVEIEKFVGKRKFFAHPKFKQEFTTENIMGVYFPYMLVDVNAHVNLSGYGEKLRRKYFRGSGDNQKAYYDADLYEVQRDFDLTINGLSIESNSERLNNDSGSKTNNVINSIMPFDVENCVKYNSNYLKGYTSERRDTNIEQLKTIVDTQSKDIARHSANSTLKEYNRGVSWKNEQVNTKGQQWKAAYLPVWLYSYQQIKGNNKILHYVAVNARTKETMGSVPIHIPKLIGVSCLIELLGLLALIFVFYDFDYNYLLLLSGFVYFIIMYLKYRNSNARHKYETETKTNISNLRNNDRFIETRTGLTNSIIEGANNTRVGGASVKNNVMNSFTADNISNTLIKNITDNNQIASFIKDNIDKGGN